MRKNLFFRMGLQVLVISIVFAYFLLARQASAQKPPGGVLALCPGGYVSGDYPGVFDALNDEGITVEFWFYLTDLPEDWQDRWVLLSKHGSYSFYIRGRRINPPWPFDDPEEIVNFSRRTLNGGGTDSIRRDPLQRWRHFAFQFKVTMLNTGSTSYKCAQFSDGMGNSDGGGTSSRAYQPDGTMFIGGMPEYGSLKGWIDEVRISDTWRYTPREPFKPAKRFGRDEHTLALWHFDEGPWAASYEDDSGNGYTLFAGGTLSVDQRGKVATVWGRLKSE